MPWSFVNCGIRFLQLSFAIGKFWVGGVRMYISVTIKRYRAIKEVGKIKMSVGVIAYYKLVQVCQAEYFRQLLKPVT
ncbi:hypothetical protein GOBAR_AA22895 [Gossypium barbadense]|uniref:Uncharacterized protein n=1 Tax=Gossypium barbadense TaxID=3634 RepID=A0A2P5X359_GOSBA|nr:hypothetical protein GOBAR_AA22895 [Gossypium barbadense]